MELNLDINKIGRIGRIRSSNKEPKMISIVLSDRNRTGIPQSKIDNIKDGISFTVDEIKYHHTDQGLMEVKFIKRNKNNKSE